MHKKKLTITLFCLSAIAIGSYTSQDFWGKLKIFYLSTQDFCVVWVGRPGCIYSMITHSILLGAIHDDIRGTKCLEYHHSCIPGFIRQLC